MSNVHLWEICVCQTHVYEEYIYVMYTFVRNICMLRYIECRGLRWWSLCMRNICISDIHLWGIHVCQIYIYEKYMYVKYTFVWNTFMPNIHLWECMHVKYTFMKNICMSNIHLWECMHVKHAHSVSLDVEEIYLSGIYVCQIWIYEEQMHVNYTWSRLYVHILCGWAMYVCGIDVRTQTAFKTRAAAARACTRQEFSPSDRQIVESISEQTSIKFILKESTCHTYKNRQTVCKVNVCTSNIWMYITIQHYAARFSVKHYSNTLPKHY